MELKVINQEFSVCKVKDLSQVDYSDKFCFIGKTDEELSLVCILIKDLKKLKIKILLRGEKCLFLKELSLKKDH